MARTAKPKGASTGSKRRPAKPAPAAKRHKAGSENGVERLKAERLALVQELEAAKRRISALERERNAVSERIEIAIKSIHKVLKTHN